MRKLRPQLGPQKALFILPQSDTEKWAWKDVLFTERCVQLQQTIIQAIAALLQGNTIHANTIHANKLSICDTH